MAFRVVGISIWVGLLTLPLTGVGPSLRIAVATGLGLLIWRGLVHLASSSSMRQWVDRIRAYPFPWHNLRKRSKFRARAMVFGTTAFLILPLILNNYYIDVLTLAGLYCVLALGLNIVVGMAGLLDLGYVSFYAIGAYFYGLASTQFGLSFWIALPLGGVVAAGFGVLLGLVTLRLRGDYLAIVTLGFIHIVHLVLNNWDSVTQGPNGILGIGRPAIGTFVFSQPIHFYYLILLIACITVFFVSRLNHSWVGRAWLAIREDEVAAAAMGIDTTKMKILAFAIGASWAGIAGVFFAGKFGFISPESFTFFESVMILSMVVLGGMGNTLGVILGAVILVILPEFLREFSQYRMLIFGLVLVLMMIFRPQGLLGRRSTHNDPLS